MDTLDLDFALPLRSFRLELALAVGRETFALVGPSGAGKTSVLRAVAGLIRPERGSITLDGRVLFDAAARIDRPPEERRVGFVFQEYALFPHMTVERNVAYAGRMHAAEVLERFRIAHLAKARPGELSGGERQRVGLARALAREPDALLLDEPLSALDTHTRADVRVELRSILDRLDLPVLLVTHDFQDAAVLADRVAVLVDGRLLQVGTPAELIAAPSDPFVASFTGANLLFGRALPGLGGLTEVTLDDGNILYSVDEAEGSVDIAVYPWEISIAREPTHDSALNHVRGHITSLVQIGNRARVQVGGLVAEVTTTSVERLDLEEGELVVASFKAAATRLVAHTTDTSGTTLAPDR
ncbi:MAG TPA: ABC transporter ATP-binding protein [Gaiellaceae bacterium]|nr:ABC transporter ATP-binding protein [Gaiellaceae bacterium]